MRTKITMKQAPKMTETKEIVTASRSIIIMQAITKAVMGRIDLKK